MGMTELTDPRDFGDWVRRVFSPPALILFAVLGALLATELKFAWVEQAVGAYLMATNADRPESGTIWEKGQKTRSALSAVDKLAADRESYQRAARNAGTLNEVLGALGPGQGVMLSSEHFRELYQKLPQGFAYEMISPFELLRFASAGRWNRTYLERSGDGVLVYLLEPGNQVLRQFKLNSTALELLARGGTAETQSLEDLQSFSGRIYAAERFFAALAAFPDDTRRSLVPQPERLLEFSGQITRVGISDQAVSGFVEIGFEIRAGTQPRVLLVQGQDWAVWRLRSILEGRKPGAMGAASPQENWSPQ
jgi:hypothetical protein